MDLSFTYLHSDYEWKSSIKDRFPAAVTKFTVNEYYAILVLLRLMQQ